MYLNMDFSKPFLTLDDEQNKLLPLGLDVDFRESKIDLLPTATQSFETMPGYDGEVSYDTSYSARLFDLVCNTPDGLSRAEKIVFQDKIAFYMNALKLCPQPLLYQGRIYMVSINGSFQPTNNGTWFQQQLPLKASDPFGYAPETKSIHANSTVLYNGTKETGVVIEIGGAELTNPSVTINGKKIEYQGRIPLNTTVTIHTEKRTAIMMDQNGQTANVFGAVTGLELPILFDPASISESNGDFIPSSNVILMSNPEQTQIRWREKFL